MYVVFILHTTYAFLPLDGGVDTGTGILCCQRASDTDTLTRLLTDTDTGPLAEPYPRGRVSHLLGGALRFAGALGGALPARLLSAEIRLDGESQGQRERGAVCLDSVDIFIFIRV